MEEKIMVPSLLTAANWPIVGQLCWILGKVMNFIYNFLDNCLPSDNGLVGLSIILYTIFVYTKLLQESLHSEDSSRSLRYSYFLLPLSLHPCVLR